MRGTFAPRVDSPRGVQDHHPSTSSVVLHGVGGLERAHRAFELDASGDGPFFCRTLRPIPRSLVVDVLLFPDPIHARRYAHAHRPKLSACRAEATVMVQGSADPTPAGRVDHEVPAVWPSCSSTVVVPVALGVTGAPHAVGGLGGAVVATTCEPSWPRGYSVPSTRYPPVGSTSTGAYFSEAGTSTAGTRIGKTGLGSFRANHFSLPMRIGQPSPPGCTRRPSSKSSRMAAMHLFRPEPTRA